MIRLTLLHTNDLHGRVHQLARIVTLIKQIRSDVTQSGGVCFYFDCGDCEDTTLLESALTKGASMEALLSAAGCDQTALGNAVPIRYGPQAIAGLATAFGKPLLCANLCEKNGDIVSGLVSNRIVDVKGIKLGLIGVTVPMPDYASAYKINPIKPEMVLPDLIRHVRNAGAKIVIVLSHLNSTNDIHIAENMDGIDLILSAHDHKRITPPLKVKETLIVEAGQYGEMLGRLDLVLDEYTGKVIKYRGELIPVTETITPDGEFMVAVKKEQKRVNRKMALEICELLGSVECFSDRECCAGNLLADALLEYVEGAQVAFVINGHWTNGLRIGKVTKHDLYCANRSTGNPARIKLTGKQIKQFLVAALKPESFMKTTESHRGIPFGWPHVSGMNVLVESKNIDQLEILVNGCIIQPDDELITAATDMEFSEILGYLPIDDEEIEYEVPTILPEVVEVYLKKHTPLYPDTKKRIRFV